MASAHRREAERRRKQQKLEEREQREGKKKSEMAELVGRLIADRCRAQNIETVVFDRNGFIYHGRVKVLADAAREAGLVF